jgi:hypothetical protein
MPSDSRVTETPGSRETQTSQGPSGLGATFSSARASQARREASQAGDFEAQEAALAPVQRKAGGSDRAVAAAPEPIRESSDAEAASGPSAPPGETTSGAGAADSATELQGGTPPAPKAAAPAGVTFEHGEVKKKEDALTGDFGTMLRKWNEGEVGKIGYVQPSAPEMKQVKKDAGGRITSAVWKMHWDWGVKKWADADRKNATQAEEKAYSLAHDAMVAHEDQHVAIDKRHYTSANVSGHVGLTEKEAVAAMNKLTDDANKANKKFDKDTEHGVSPPAGQGESTHMRYP